MKFLIGVLLMSSFSHAQSLYDQRSTQAEEANKAYYHELYRQRSAEMISKIQEKIQRMTANHGGFSAFSFDCADDYRCVSGSTFIGYGSFNTGDGLGCKIDMVTLDFIYCKGAEMTNCPDFPLRVQCLDANNAPVFLGTPAAQAQHGHPRRQRK